MSVRQHQAQHDVAFKPELKNNGLGCRLTPLKETFASFYRLSSFFGHNNCFYHNNFRIGLGLWIANLVIHFCLDFYEAHAVFGPAWATAIGMFLITFATASVSLAKVTLVWLENSLVLLYYNGNYPETLRIMKIILRLVPIIVVCLGLSGGAGQYTCYYMDGATRLDFGNVLPSWLQVVLNVLRFTSLLHMFCGYSLFLAAPICVMIVSQLSMKEFKVSIEKEFKNTSSSLSFGKAATLFEERASFVRKSSSSCWMVLTILVMSSTLSFVINAYNFLFVRRLAIYFWFAVLPLLWVVIPLAIAAWVTETYQTFAGLVLKNWAQSSREETEVLGSWPNDRISSARLSCDVCRVRGSAENSWPNDTGGQYTKRKFSKRVGRKMRNVIRPLQINNLPTEGQTSVGTLTIEDLEEQSKNTTSLKQCISLDVSSLEPTHQAPPGGKVVPSSQNMTTRFDYERYMIYLQCLLPDVGFSIGGFLISWDKVFALGLFMASMSAVFIQEVLFGSRKNTLGRS